MDSINSAYNLADTVRLGLTEDSKKMQMVIPGQMGVVSGVLGISVDCAAKFNLIGIAKLDGYGDVDWAGWASVQGEALNVTGN